MNITPLAFRTLLAGAAIAVLPALLASPAVAAGEAFTAIASTTPQFSRDSAIGRFAAARMSVSIVLAPRNAADLANRLTAVSDPRSATYGHFLAKGEYVHRYGPSAAQIDALSHYLAASGLVVTRTASPLIVRATGRSSAIESTFRTRLVNYRTAAGKAYFANVEAARMPAAIATRVSGIVGLTDTVRLHPYYKLANRHAVVASATKNAAASCEAPYPTAQQLFGAVQNGTPFAFGYGDGPGCNGLSPKQTNSIYQSPQVGARGKGQGANIAVFELSAYQPSDIAQWTSQFYGAAYTAPLTNILVDGGSLNPICPTDDTCPAQYNSYAGDIEVDADIEQQLSLSKDISNLFVYDSPNDYTGQTELDQYAQIASDDFADAISSSWGSCENDAGFAYAQAENAIFQQLALQGESMFASSGDNGAFGCIGGDGSNEANVNDPASQPWVTSVGGTSFYSYNPGQSDAASYPTGIESVWNVDDLCNQSSYEGGVSGYTWCALVGAGGGGESEYWTEPYYQSGKGLARGNRHVPDISADADPYTPYAEYCTANANTPYSACGFSSYSNVPGWFGIGGTSLSSPLWSGIIADRVGYHGHRVGNVNPMLYEAYDAGVVYYGLHDITGVGQLQNNNGLFKTKVGYDRATGIGTPIMSSLITASP